MLKIAADYYYYYFFAPRQNMFKNKNETSPFPRQSIYVMYKVCKKKKKKHLKPEPKFS